MNNRKTLAVGFLVISVLAAVGVFVMKARNEHPTSPLTPGGNQENRMQPNQNPGVGNNIEKEPTASDSSQFAKNGSSAPSNVASSVHVNSAPLTETSARIVKAFFSEDILKIPSRDVVARFQEMGFNLTDKQSGHPDTGLRTTYNILAPQSGYSRLQVQYVKSNNREVLEGIRFTTHSNQFHAMIEQAVRENPNLKLETKTEDLVIFERGDGYNVWFRAFDEKNPPPQGGDPNVMNGGLEPDLS